MADETPRFGAKSYEKLLHSSTEILVFQKKPHTRQIHNRRHWGASQIMKFLRERVLKGETMFGVAAQLGSALTVEMIGRAGFDWTWIDCEHGSGDYSELIHQIQVARLGESPAVVRIAWNEPTRFKRVLDLGAAGIMVPYVNTAKEARQAAQSMRYQPEGIRGVASSPPACGFGQGFDDYYAKANDNLLTVVQIETVEGVKNADEIAAVPGVDVLFVGPRWTSPSTWACLASSRMPPSKRTWSAWSLPAASTARPPAS